MTDAPLRAIGAFDALLAPLAAAATDDPLRVRAVRYALATVMARDGQQAALGTALGIDPPDGPELRDGAGFALLGTAPGTWLAIAESGDPFWARQLADRLVSIAAVADQSSGYAVLQLRGSAVRDLLSRGVSIDLHPDSFGAGRVAVTMIAHIGVIVWQRDADLFELAVFRSQTGSLWHWLSATAGAMGIVPARF